MWRIAWLPESATITAEPSAEKLKAPCGLLKAALAAGPSKKPMTPLPASVTTRAELLEIRRMRELDVSATMTLPRGSIATEEGPFSRALLPTASSHPGV